MATGTIRLARVTTLPSYYVGLGLAMTLAAAIADPRTVANWITDALVPAVESHAAIPPAQPALGLPAIDAPPPASEPAIIEVASAAAAGSDGSWPKSSWPAPGEALPSKERLPFESQAVNAVLTFQQGVSGYTGTADTHIHQATPTSNFGNALAWKWDTEDAAPNQVIPLIRFDNIFGGGAGQIPVGSTITSATLQFTVFNSSAAAGTLNEVLVDWVQGDGTSGVTWNTFGAAAGAQSGTDYNAASVAPLPLAVGTASLTVTSSIAAWSANPTSNRGWILVPASNDGGEGRSAEYGTVAERPLLSVTYDPPSGPCTTNGDCNDGNSCTTDTCDLGPGTCSHVTISCSWGTCNPTHGQCEVVGMTFQNGAAGYSGTVDTWLEEAAPTANHGSDVSIFMDNSPNRQALIRFDGIFGGNGSSQIPPGSTIRSATLTVNVNDASDTGAAFHRMLSCWDDTNTWSTFGAGIQANGVEAVPAADVPSTFNNTAPPVLHNIDVTSSLVAWSAGATNLGWVALPLGSSGWGLDSEDGTVKPLLSVTFTPPAACATDANCNDGNGCTTDTCNTGTGFCNYAANAGGSCADGVACTNDTCSTCGRCASVDGCTFPNVCNVGNGQCEASPVPPSLPTNPSPADDATGVSTSPELCVDVSDPNGGNLTVTFKGREGGGGTGAPFTVIAMPDTQFYSESFPATYTAQTTWIRDNRVARNIVVSVGLGDCVNVASTAAQWTNADAANSILENPTTTGLTDGIPYGIAVGNHDQNPAGAARSGADENVTTVLYNQTFPKSRFAGRAYHGGNYPLPGFTDSMDNHYELFSASGMDFIVFHLEWDDGGGCSWPADGTPPTGTLNTCQNVLTWARNLLVNTHPNRRAIIATHFMGTPTSGGTGTLPLSPQGQAIVNMAKGTPNVFLALGGHLDQADSRTDLANDGHTIYTFVSDYQSRPNGGNGWLRIMTFDPVADTIHVEVYSPTLNRFINKLNDGTPNSHADNLAAPENEFTVPYAMDAGLPFQTIGVNASVPSGTRTCRTWPGLTANTLHEWKVEVSDGTYTTDPIWSFTTGSSCSVNADCNDGNPCTTDTCTLPAGTCSNAGIPLCCTTAAQCDDANVCTTDSCNGSNTCDHVNNAVSCSDGNACTTGDACNGGACVGGAAPNCNDANACTTDSCVPATGCAHAYAPSAGCCASSADCNDGNAATTDLCALPAGNCSNTANVSCTTSAECNDGDNCTTDVCNGPNVAALSFDGTDDFVTFGTAAGLGSAQFTIETWFKRTGTGAGNSTGTGGIASLVPLVTKGAPEADGSSVDANYVFGINTAGNVLAADFEQFGVCTGGTGNCSTAPFGAGCFCDANANCQSNVCANPGQNRPVSGTTAIVNNTWYHAAATYDGTTWRLYLNGNIEATLVVGAFTPRSDSTQNAGLGAMLTSAGARLGAFQGLLDEPRIWNVVRTQAEIQASMNQQLTSGTGLVGRWALNEGTGPSAADSTTPAENGTLTNGTAWSTSDKPSIGDGTCGHTAVANCCNTAAQCDDANPCTADSCSANLCQHTAIGGCCLTAADCNDSNGCTDDTCNGSNTCEHANNTAPCNDGNICTTSDSCSGGSCQPGTAVPNCCQADAACNDGNACTSDYCATTNDAALSLASPGAIANHVDLALGTGSNASPDYINFFGTSSFTIEGWIYTDGGAAASTGVFRHGRQGDFAQVVVQLTGTGNLQLMGSVESNAAGADQVDVTSPTVLTANTWNHFALVVVRDLVTPANQQIRIHVNGGAPTTTTSGLWSTSAISSTDQSMLGVARLDTGALTLPFDGRIDEVRIWNYARTQTEIAADMSHEIESATGLVHRWSFNAGTGTSAIDSVGGITGTLVGTATWSATALAFAGSDSCVHGNVTNGTICSDGDACTTTDVCTTGVCAGTAINCDDGNSCTTDSCSGGVCSHTSVANGTSCTDGSVCTTGDACSSGACVGTPITCNDSNACTDDSCNPGTGCVFTNDNTNTCSDGLACTGDACNGGVCVSWYAPTAGCCASNANCNDGVAATTDTCVGPPNGTCSNVVSGSCTTAAQCNDSNGCTTDACVGAVSSSALSFDGVDDNVSFGTAAGLGSAQFTIETWFKRTGTGVANTTGTGGIASLVPLVTKGAPEADASAVDANYILGINTAGNVLAADFEQFGVCTGGTGNCSTAPFGAGCFCDVNANCQSNVCANPGLNRPVSGTTAIVNNTWYHAAATYDGTTWRLYLNGNIEATLVVGAFTPRSNSTQFAGLGAMLTSTGARLGAFQGALDEPRIWNVVRTQSEIQASMNQELTSGTGLVGRWGLFEGSGTAAADSATSPTAENGTLRNGTVAGNGPIWTTDSPFTAVPGTCTNTAIPNCSPCAADYQCNDSNQCTADSCATANVAAVELDGTNDVVDLGNDGNSASVNYLTNFGTSNFSIEGWFWVDALPTDNTSLFRQGSQNAFPQVVVQAKTGNKLAASIETSTTGTQVDTSAGAQPTFALGQWHHFALVVVRDLATPANQRMNLYLNGVLAESTVATLWGTNPINDSSLAGVRDTVLLGAVRTAGGGAAAAPFLDGRLDEIRIWDHSRTAQQILDNKNKQLLAAPGLVHRWSFNEGTGTTAGDSIGTSQGTLTNGPTWRTNATDIPTFGANSCVFTAAANGSSCSDGNACTQSDTCQVGACTSGSPAPGGTACGSSSDTACDNPDTCNGSGTCQANTETNGAACSDGNACTTGDSCTAGSCVSGSALSCDDSNPCTTDSCSPATGCVHTNNTDACNDGNACTTGDVCGGGSCQPGSAVVCNDSNACTTDTCDSGTGCVYTNNTSPCSDGNTCTTGDVCGGGSCQPGTAVVCNDNNVCTTDTCDTGSGCVFTNNTNPCSDGNACTTGDVCGGGSCQPGTGLVCNDGNVCTTDTCDTGTGCVYTNNTNPCSDGNACTTGDVCGGGSCQPGTGVVCNDGNVCTTDTCDSGTGCVYTNNTDPCSDGNACTTGDVCGGGSCQPGAGTLTCNDSNACTTDTCAPASGCVFTNNTNACDDGNACTTGDVCGGGSCQPGTGTLTCNDSNACTTDTCVPPTGCVFTNNTNACDDGNACTTGDVCGGGSCQPGTGTLTCNDSNACTTDTCAPASGCVFTNNTNACDDGNACTTGDACGGGSCQPGAGALTCNDSNACTTDTCVPPTGCVFTNNTSPCSDGNACTTGDVCGGGSCQPGGALVCNDSNACTTDTCAPATGCVFTNNTNACDDGNACTTGDVCGGGSCQPGTGTLTCNDSNVCTTDTCVPPTGCVFTNNTNACDDGNECTTADTCSGGTCAGTGIVCNDNNPCTTDSCSLSTGCVFTNNTNACDDGNACTTGDVCGGGTCTGATPVVCNDGNVCTTDTCAPATGCVYTNNTGPCFDGDACTTGDICSGGTCQPGTGTLSCDDSSICTTDTCAPASGCVYTAIDCSDGDSCTYDTCVNPSGCEHTATCEDEQEETAPPGGTVSSDPEGDGATPDDQIETAVTTPSGGQVTINEGSATQPLPSGYEIVNLQIVISAPPASAASPLSLTFRIDASALPNGYVLAYLTIFRNGAVVAECTGSPGQAVPDPCVSSRSVLGDGDVQLTVLTSNASTWNVAFPDCDDGNPCTDDSGTFPSCSYTNNTDSCDDENACTTGDICGGGVCAGATPVVCNDGILCTTDTCDTANGCVFTNNTDPCSDGNACTTGDTCGGGVCVAGSPTVCNDSNACTTDTCAPASGCVFTNNTSPCSDGNACTTGDTCGGGVCVAGSPTVCNDSNGCTTDTCNSGSGCVFTNNTSPCSDGNACTTGDTCGGGVCVAGSPTVCNDSNGCTTDTCNSGSGCVFTNNTSPCSDGSACTTGDVCGGGSCQPGTAVVCNDSNACTNDTCAPVSGCVFTNNTNACDDGSACTTGDACGGGSCQPGTAVVCTDGNLCTTDSCVPASGCAFAPVVCSAGFACNPGNGLCEATTAPPLPIVVGDAWRYFKGTVEPAPPPNPPAWAAIAYNDSSWSSGPSGFGYGPDCVAQRGTTLSDMQNPPSTPGYFSIYVRRAFDVTNPAAVTSLTVGLDYDDAAVIYINGVEMVRTASLGGTAGTPTAFDFSATTGHECSVCDGTPCNPAQSFPITLGAGGNPLVAGTNVIAIHAHNMGIGSSDFTLIPTVTATLAQCSVDGDCNDSVPCTTDTCVASVCQHASNCSGGQTCNVGTGLCETAPVTVTFQQGAGSPVYNGTVDTFIQSGSSTNNSGVSPLTVDGVPPTTDERQILIRFDNIFGNGAGQIPAGSTVTSATLEVNVTNAMAQLTSFNRMLRTWNPSDIWTTFGSVPWNANPGVQADGVEALATDDPGSPTAVALSPPMQSITLTSSVQAWAANPASNFGWVLRAAAADSLVFDSSEGTTAALRPKLTVVYVPPASNCTIDADCSDNNACNGIETCVATVCQPGTALNCDDSNVCTTDSCSPTLGCQHADNTLACNDANACTSGDVCAAGVCSGVAISCDDGVACTADSCNSGTGCQHVSTCTGGQTCNISTGLCESGPVTTTFQDGLAGYLGTQDTYLAQSAPTTVEGALDNWRWDLENPAPNAEFGLIRFDGIVGSGAGQIPAGSTITSATLTLEVTNNTVAPEGSVNESVVAWSEATATWNNFGGDAGVQADEYLASPQYLAPLPTGSANILVTASVQAWVSGTRSNFGWVFRPNSIDGAQVDSAEFATATLRPKLTVVYVPPAAGCTIDADCSDNNVCNGIETCVATACQPGTALNCDDSNVCTTDSCSPTLGCQHVNNTIACNDANACTSGDVCAAGVCSGVAISCDDGVACTADSCNSGTGCQHVSTCSGGQTCNLTSGLCESGPVTVTFQQGFAGYGGSADTFIDAALGSQATASPIVIDSSPVEQALLRFDAIFGSAPGQIPAGSTITSATLTLWAGAVANDQSANPVNLHRLLHGWSDTGVWADYGVAPWNAQAGIQNDGVDALSALSGTATIATVATSAAINVTTSLQAWVSSPSSNFGWAILPTGTDGLRVESNESTTAANTRRPLLSVTFTPPAGGCTADPQCDDANACNGLETCVATVCQAGTPLVCNDSNVCTTDTCAPASGCVFTNNAAACNDNNACTTADTCAAGSCVGGAALVCNDSNVCTTDTCAPASGCVFTNNTAACNDNNACTTSDTCSAGSCVGGAALVCNDSNVCTTDTCAPASGCVFTNNTAACNDNNACTTSDTCSGGSCVGGAALVCNDGNVCTTDSCSPASGCVTTPITGGGTTTCGLGVCQVTVTNCIAGVPQTCTPGPSSTEACDGLDNNCDGSTDENGAAVCADDNTCNGIETCGGASGCQAGTPPVVTSTISIPDVITGPAGGTVSVPVLAQPAAGIGIDLTVTYDPAVLQPTSVVKSLLTQGGSLSSNMATPGTVRISIFSTTPFTGAGPLAFIQFNVIGSAGTGSPLGLTRADINEGAISTCRNGGGFTACGTPNAAVTGVTVNGHVSTTVAWTGLGGGIHYDVASGSLSALPTDLSTIAASCLASNAAVPSIIDPRGAPAAGDGYYYLVRPQDACAIGTYGQGSNGDERWPAAACP